MSWSSLLTMCNMKHVPVCTSTYQYVPVHTEQWNDINSIYWYVLVHTGECTNLYIPVRTRTYAYSPFFCAFKKKCKRVLNPRSSAYFSKNLPLHHGSTDLNAGYLLCCHWCIYYLQRPPVSARGLPQQCQKCKMLLLQVGHATFGSSTTNTAESRGYMLLVRLIWELCVLE